ncbi:MAG: site-specific DNA-methyltransferase [Oscillospiraceae bacterium]|nr:site-specific DNA-methyltransferase [Oscillospiraceae bacterium]
MPTLNGNSLDLLEENIKNLRQLFPEVECDGKIDFDMLRQILGEYVDDDKERYNFKWNGKGKALRFSQTPSTGTLRPCKEESKDWDDTQNLYIEGDNLEVLKILQKSYHGKIKMIYIDPPYNTGNDFVYPDNYHDSLENYKAITGQTDEEGNRISTNTEASGRFHTDWLNMMYPRLRLARNLLTDDGVIFISIDDNEVDNLRRLCNEIFGEDNFIATFPWRKRTAKSDVPFGVSQDYEWILCYSKSNNYIARVDGTERKYYETDDFPNRPWRVHDLTKQTTASERPNSYFTIVNPQNGNEYPANPNRTWAITEETFQKYYAENRIVFPGDYDFLNISKPVLRYWKEDDMKKAGDMFGMMPASTKLPEDIGMSLDGTKEITDLFDGKVFSFPKTINLIRHFIDMSTKIDKNAIILDFFSGSATTAHAVMQLNAEDGGNRRFICVQLPEPTTEDTEAFKAGYKNICEIGKERIRRAGEKIKTEIESGNGQLKFDEEPKKVPDIGFKVFKLDSSNLKKWNPDFDNLELTLDDMINNYVPDRTEEDVVYEFMLKMGLDLSYPVDVTEIDGKKVHSIGFGALMMCLDDNVTVSVAEGMVKMYKELAPETWKVIFKDEGFADDCTKTNIKLTLIQAGLEEDAFTTV